MDKYFWREKNALFCMDKAKVYNPSPEELERELVKKLAQKVDRIDVIFDKKAREEYYKNDKKPKELKLESYTESELQALLGTQYLADFLQVLCDLCDFYKIDRNLQKIDCQNDKEIIKAIISQSVIELQCKQNIKENLQKVAGAVAMLADMLNLSHEMLEEKRIEKEKKQGSFLKGKYVEFA